MPEPKPARVAGITTVNISATYQPSTDPVHVNAYGQLQFIPVADCDVYFEDPSMFGVTNPQHEPVGQNNPPLNAAVANGTNKYAIVAHGAPPPPPPGSAYPHTIKIP